MNLLRALAIVGAVLLAAGVTGAVAGVGIVTLWPIVVGGVIVVGTIFERRYHAETSRRSLGPGWVPTDERIHEPDGTVTEVWYRPATGERRYVRSPTP